jgi:L-rhamnose isomerase
MVAMELEASRLQVLNAKLKFFPSGDVWAEYCARQGVIADGAWLNEVEKYESEVLSKR